MGPVAVEMAAHDVEIGWWIVRAAWGPGLASEGGVYAMSRKAWTGGRVQS
jgi:hypothetical protein